MIHINPQMIAHLPGADDIQRHVLPNGITLLTRYHPDSPSVVVSGYVSSGSLYDPADKLGRAHFTALALMRGTKNRNFQEIYNSLESMGASLVFGASVHSTGFGGRALSEDLPALMNLLSDSLRQPAFPTDQLERLRMQMMASLAIRAQDTSSMASLAFDRYIYPNHAYGLPEDGYPETIQQIQRDDLIKAHVLHFGPKNFVLAVVGGMEGEKVLEVVRNSLGDWENAQQAAIIDPGPAAVPAHEIREHIAIAGKSQTDIVMGNSAMKRESDDFYAGMLGNNILGQFGMMGRIGYVVREQAGLAYYASSSLNASQSAGAWEINAGVNPSNVEKAIALVQQEVRRFIQDGVSAEELEESQANYIGRLPLSMESNQGVAAALINIERYQLGLNYYREYPASIAGVTLEQVQKTAARYLDPEKMVIISAGVANE